MSHNFWLDYIDEAYAIVSQDWVEKTGVSPGGFDLKALEDDFSQL